MSRKLFFTVLSVIMVITLAGCATGRRSQSDTEVDSLQNQITMLQMQLEEREQAIESLRDELALTEMRSGAVTPASSARVVSQSSKATAGPTTKQVQAALLNAGFNPGSIDGKMGNKTREAIKAFQKANDLKVDGKVGPQTWSLLKKYLKVK